MISPRNFYYKNPRQCFEEGWYVVGKKRRHYHQKYVMVKYFLPAKLSSAIRAIRTYFKELDSYYADPIYETAYKFRQTPFEFYETCIGTLRAAKLYLDGNVNIEIGTQMLSPIAWASLGKGNRFAQKYFNTFDDLLNYYHPFLRCKGYNEVIIDRLNDFKPESDALELISDCCDFSVNKVLAISILFTFDVLRYGGLDMQGFKWLFTNDNRPEMQMLYPWHNCLRIIRESDDPTANISLKTLHKIHSNYQLPLNPGNYKYVPPRKSIQNVQVEQIGFDENWFEDETKNYFSYEPVDVKAKDSSVPLLSYKVDSIFNEISLDDDEDENESARLDQEMREKIERDEIGIRFSER